MPLFEKTHRTSFRLTTIVIVDDFAELRAGVRKMLEEQAEWQIVAEACDGSEAIQRAGELHPDLVLLDMGMPGLSGLEAAGQILQISPESKVVFLTQESDDEIRRAAVEAGAHGYVLKANAASELRLSPRKKCTFWIARNSKKPLVSAIPRYVRS
jgi:DNA-binding NarL/FixJ family response regulator